MSNPPPGWTKTGSSIAESRANTHEKKYVTREEEDRQWTEKYGAKGQKIIRDCVEENVADYEYLKQFALKVPAREMNGANGSNGADTSEGTSSD